MWCTKQEHGRKVVISGECGEIMSEAENRFPKSLIEFQDRFATESACAQYLFKRRWPEGFVCPSCGNGRAWPLKAKAFTPAYA